MGKDRIRMIEVLKGVRREMPPAGHAIKAKRRYNRYDRSWLEDWLEEEAEKRLRRRT
jgi:hypothetical protein